MTIIDPGTSIGKIRLRTGDWGPLPLLPDSVIQSALDDSESNLPRAAKLCAQYILAMLSFKTHQKLAQIEIWTGEQFANYLKFIQMTILNPNMADIAPLPYSGSTLQTNDILEFLTDWRMNYSATQSQQLAYDADLSPNDDTRTGIIGNPSRGYKIL